MELPKELQELMLDMHLRTREMVREHVLADPAKHKTTLEFPEGSRMNWRYLQVKGKRGPRVRYCYSTERNLAGYFIAWRETWNAKTGVGKRDMIIASKRRATIRARNRARFEAHQKRIGA